jgi:CBS domain-containing protein
MFVRDVMTPEPARCIARDRLDQAAKTMRDHDCAELPVCEGSRPIGVITEHDIASRAVAAGMTPVAVQVGDVMSHQLHEISADAPVERALDLLEKDDVTRLQVVDSNGRLVGVLSLTDLLARAPSVRVARMVRRKVAERAHAEAAK